MPIETTIEMKTKNIKDQLNLLIFEKVIKVEKYLAKPAKRRIPKGSEISIKMRLP